MNKTYITLRIARLRLLLWRLLTTRAVWRTVQRAMQWMAPAA